MLSLAVELLQEIGKQVADTDRQNLRAVCRHLGFAINPLFFSSIVLKVHKQRPDPGRELDHLKALATGNTGWTQFASKLILSPAYEIPARGDEAPADGDSLDTQLQEIFGLALQSLKNIRTVMWEIRYIPYRGMPRLGWLGAVDNSPPWHRSLIVEFLASSTLLTNLELSLDKAADLKGLERLAGLRRLKIEVYCQPFLAPETLGRQVTHIVAHNRHLCSLQLATSRREDPGWSEIWTLLRTERIYLKQISDNAISTEFLEYLSSYSGLERLTLHPLGCSAVNSGRLADMFFDAVLPRHADSLVELSCLAEFEGKWSFGAHNAEQISQLKQLTRLEMSVNSYDMATTESDRRSSKNTVELMLETAAQLHAVRIIAILPAESELNRRDGTGHDGNPSTHKGAVLLNIKTTVRSFRPCSTSPAIVRAGYTFHELKKSATTPDTFAYCEYEHPNISWQRIKYLMEEE